MPFLVFGLLIISMSIFIGGKLLESIHFHRGLSEYHKERPPTLPTLHLQPFQSTLANISFCIFLAIMLMPIARAAATPGSESLVNDAQVNAFRIDDVDNGKVIANHPYREILLKGDTEHIPKEGLALICSGEYRNPATLSTFDPDGDQVINSLVHRGLIVQKERYREHAVYAGNSQIRNDGDNGGTAVIFWNKEMTSINVHTLRGRYLIRSTLMMTSDLPQDNDCTGESNQAIPEFRQLCLAKLSVDRSGLPLIRGKTIARSQQVADAPVLTGDGVPIQAPKCHTFSELVVAHEFVT